MKRRILATAIAVLCFIAAVGIILYPAVSNYVNAKYRSEIRTNYEEDMAQTDNTELEALHERAIAYNISIAPGAVSSETYSQESLRSAAESYDEQLSVAATGIMGYVDIPSIHVYLPIYHGTDSETLENGIGHLLGSSLPVGGETTHAVLTGHSGMASQSMFTDLHQLQEGDVFYLHVLTETLAYKVTQIYTVLPHDTSFLEIEKGKDLCTLVTCTPVGINTHRLLVRGNRIPYTEAENAQSASSDTTISVEPSSASWQEQYLLGIVWGLAGTVSVSLIVITLVKLKNRKRKKRRKGGRYLYKKRRKLF